MDCILIILGFMVLCFTVQVQGEEIPCGRRMRKGWKKTPRIIGGTDNAIQGEFPWITSLKYDGGGHMCGGTIIHKRFLIVAAHCFSTNNMLNPEKWTATMGQINKSNSIVETTVRVEKIILYPEYDQTNNTNNKNDIAVLKLSRDIEWTDHIQPACLPTSDPVPGTKVAFSGWGQSRNPNRDDILQTVTMVVYTNAHCQQLISDWKVLTILESQMCAGNGTEGGIYISDGDSGGGLMALINGRWTIAAVASYIPRESFLSGDIPSVFTRVNNFKHWIEMTAAKESQ